MSELSPFVTLPGLQAIGDDGAGFCADGACVVPLPGADRVAPESPEDPSPTR